MPDAAEQTTGDAPPEREADQPEAPANALSGVASAAGYVLAVSYPVLALSTGTRALYQLFFKEGFTDYRGATLSAVAAGLYLVAAIGFAYRRRWTWYLSVSALSLETLLTIAVGTVSLIQPELVGRTVWRLYGVDYGFFPLFQPLLGLLWLLWPVTVRAYGVDQDPAGRWLSRLGRWYGVPAPDEKAVGRGGG